MRRYYNGIWASVYMTSNRQLVLRWPMWSDFHCLRHPYTRHYWARMANRGRR